MAVETFTWDHLSEPNGKVAFSVTRAQYGEGYSQRVPAGLNNKVQSWPLVFAGDDAFIQAITDFLDRHAGAKAFYWTPPMPGATQGLYTCAEYDPLPYGNGDYQLAASFQQEFSP